MSDSWCPLGSKSCRLRRLPARAQIGLVMPKLTGQSADFSIAYAVESGAARIGRLILAIRNLAGRKPT
jgi:hypothetical protein